MRIPHLLLAVRPTIDIDAAGGRKSQPVSCFGDDLDISPRRDVKDEPRGEDQIEEAKPMGMQSV